VTRRSLLIPILLAAACGGAGAGGKQPLPDPANQWYSTLSSIWAFSDKDVWAAGDRVLHFDGTRWAEVAGPGNGLLLSALWGLAPDDLWATSGSRIFRWRGAASGWVEVKHGISNPPSFQAIWVLSESDYAVGGGDVNWEVVRVKGGTVTRSYTHGQTTAIWGASSDDAWAVADLGGGLWHWTGGKWNQVQVSGSTSGNPTSVWGSSASVVWAASDYGPLLHWDGTTWKPVTVTSEHTDLLAVWAASASDVWAAGDDGAVFHFDGKSWSGGETAQAVEFQRISGSGPASVWAVGRELSTSGNHGVVYRLK
jgi:hypothetical protein